MTRVGRRRRANWNVSLITRTPPIACESHSCCDAGRELDLGQDRTTTAGHSSCADPSFDDGAWRDIRLPHDWSIEDLPTREDDTEFPVLGVRYGEWRLHIGDDGAWSSPGYDDSGGGLRYHSQMVRSLGHRTLSYVCTLQPHTDQLAPRRISTLKTQPWTSCPQQKTRPGTGCARLPKLPKRAVAGDQQRPWAGLEVLRRPPWS